jgi:hypothetical protein
LTLCRQHQSIVCRPPGAAHALPEAEAGNIACAEWLDLSSQPAIRFDFPYHTRNLPAAATGLQQLGNPVVQLLQIGPGEREAVS